MDASSIFLGRKLIERIEEKRKEMLRPLLQGAATDYADYRDRAGFLRALIMVTEWIDEISAIEDTR